MVVEVGFQEDLVHSIKESFDWFFFPSIFSFHIDIHIISLVLAKSMYIKKHDKVSSFHISPNACINIFDFYVYSLVESKLGGKKINFFCIIIQVLQFWMYWFILLSVMGIFSFILIRHYCCLFSYLCKLGFYVTYCL